MGLPFRASSAPQRRRPPKHTIRCSLLLAPSRPRPLRRPPSLLILHRPSLHACLSSLPSFLQLLLPCSAALRLLASTVLLLAVSSPHPLPPGPLSPSPTIPILDTDARYQSPGRSIDSCSGQSGSASYRRRARPRPVPVSVGTLSDPARLPGGCYCRRP